ncbi:MAG TPA: hypothetical protein PLJ27_18495 [Polyangiaceae bacterium]|jgi:eight-cysteine-cluster-containing protein|nr:MAG: hypothetical protein BWY17_00241 [Deltaproteobacteria bacterium ADurb.Bin207]HNS99026.1 hypothetical protein [Polyangiaceae bacterium]HNZ22267.1 hypothetical protein [Polyangiaceae bacterium]HOD25507.1 hypothetical protein [Polyangiaceae bacterium]HOE47093.1 hypothetical protein [Polyangiaceae bacterium]
MKLATNWMVLALSFPLFACSGTVSNEGTHSASEKLSRQEAKALDKADWPTDYCEVNGWYGDGVYCDDFCPLPDPDCAQSCASLGGECLSDPMDVGFGANCEQLGRRTLTGACEAFNQTCCSAPSSSNPTCEEMGGTCLSDPMDVGFGAKCEQLGRVTMSGRCEAINQTCCSDKKERTPVEEHCIRNAGDSCEADADCQTGGCGGELCYNPAFEGGISTCDCAEPQPPLVAGCGCVDGVCSWYK